MGVGFIRARTLAACDTGGGYGCFLGLLVIPANGYWRISYDSLIDRKILTTLLASSSATVCTVVAGDVRKALAGDIVRFTLRAGFVVRQDCLRSALVSMRRVIRYDLTYVPVLDSLGVGGSEFDAAVSVANVWLDILGARQRDTPLVLALAVGLFLVVGPS